MRKGKVSESQEVVVNAAPESRDPFLLGRFLRSYYTASRPLPDTILLPLRPTGFENWVRQLARRRGKAVRILVPEKGGNRSLLDLARRNAEKILTARMPAPVPPALEELKNRLELPSLPRHIEGFDVSNTGGTEIVGSSVSFIDGQPDKNGYRRYKIRSVRTPNDVAGLQEIVGRRLSRLRSEGPKVGWLPDLVLVDGGLGQLQAARKALFEQKLSRLPVVALAKKNEVLYSVSRREGVALARSSAALKLLQRVRDEAHRFAVAFHRRRRSRASHASLLDGVRGLGPKKKKALLEEFKSLERIRELEERELARRIGARPARALHEKLLSEEAEDDRRDRD